MPELTLPEITAAMRTVIKEEVPLLVRDIIHEEVPPLVRNIIREEVPTLVRDIIREEVPPMISRSLNEVLEDNIMPAFESVNNRLDKLETSLNGVKTVVDRHSIDIMELRARPV